MPSGRLKATRIRDDVIAQAQSKSGSSRQGLFALVMIGCALIAWVIWLGHKQARYEDEERTINAERVEWLQAVNYWIHHPEESMPELIQCLKQEEAVGRRSAGLALYQIGPKARDWLPEIAPAIDDDDTVVRRFALLSLTRLEADLGPWTEQIAARLVDDDSGVREAAARAIAHIGTLAAPAVSRTFVSCRADASVLLMTVLSHLGTDDPDALARIRQTLRNKSADPKLRLVAFHLLQAIAQLNADDVEAGLQSDDFQLEGAAVYACSELQLDSPSLAEAFERFLARITTNDPQRTMGERMMDDFIVISAAWNLGVSRDRLAPRLRSMIERGEYSHSELRLLREIDREEALRFLPRTLEWASDPTNRRNWQGWQNLQALGPDAAECLPFILERLRRRYESETAVGEEPQREAVREIAARGPAAGDLGRAMFDSMLRQSVEESRWVDSQAFCTLGTIGPAARDAVPLLVAWLKLPPASFISSSEPFSPVRGRASAIDALRQIGVWNDEVKDCLEPLRNDDAPDVRQTVLVALAELDPDHSRHVDDLVAALDDSHCLVRRAAAAALGRLGEAATEATPALRKAAQTPGNAVSPRVILLGDEQILTLYGLNSYGRDARIRERTVRECALDAIEGIERSTGP